MPFLTSGSLNNALLGNVHHRVLSTVFCGLTAVEDKIVEVAVAADTVPFLTLVGRGVWPVYNV